MKGRGGNKANHQATRFDINLGKKWLN